MRGKTALRPGDASHGSTKEGEPADESASVRRRINALRHLHKALGSPCHRIRSGMKAAPLSEIVEFDETFVSGKHRGIGDGGHKTVNHTGASG